MWHQNPPFDQSWTHLWNGYIRCECGGLRQLEGECPACHQPLPTPKPYTVMESDGSTVQISQAIYPGAEGRYEDWVYLKMLEREWLRPLTDADRFLSISEPSRPAARAIIVIVFWSYFETRVERLLRHGMGHLPHGVVEDLLRRYSSVGSRLDRLYKIVYSTTYHADLTALGYSEVSRLLDRVQLHRNEFTHGHPEAIDDALIESLVGGLKDEHESWIAVFNKRVSEARPQTP